MILLLFGSIGLAGDLQGDVALDVFTGRSRSAEAGAGQPEGIGTTELGLAIRLDGTLVDRLDVHVDWREREPIGGEARNVPLRLLYRGELSYRASPAVLVALGRFVAPAPTFVAADGLRLEVRSGPWSASAWGGRRGFSASRLELGGFLPVAGVAVARTTPGLQASLRAAYTTDRLELIEGDPAPLSGLSAQLRVAAAPVEPVRIGGYATAAQQAAVALGPAWGDVSVEAQALGLWQAGAWLDWEIVPGITVSVDEHHQEVAVFTARTTDRAGAVVDLGEPRFTDSQVSARAVLFEHLRVEPRFRWRMRPDRQELRWGARLEGFDLGVDGPFARASAFFDELTGGQPDRVAWSASGGWDRGDLDAEVGARVTERELAPFSGRRADGERGEDLSPFVLGTQQVAFVHVGWSGKTLFAAADVERSLRDDEWRAFVQIGAMAGVDW